MFDRQVEQFDVDQDMIKFIGTSADDNSQTLVDDVNLPNSGSIKGWIKVYVQDDKTPPGQIPAGVYYIPFYDTPTAP